MRAYFLGVSSWNRVKRSLNTGFTFVTWQIRWPDNNKLYHEHRICFCGIHCGTHQQGWDVAWCNIELYCLSIFETKQFYSGSLTEYDWLSSTDSCTAPFPSYSTLICSWLCGDSLYSPLGVADCEDADRLTCTWPAFAQFDWRQTQPCDVSFLCCLTAAG